MTNDRVMLDLDWAKMQDWEGARRLARLDAAKALAEHPPKDKSTRNRRAIVILANEATVAALDTWADKAGIVGRAVARALAFERGAAGLVGSPIPEPIEGGLPGAGRGGL